MKCFYLVGYHGCGKTTQANLLEEAFPQYNYIGGRLGLDTVRNVQQLVDAIKATTAPMVIHGCIFQTEPMMVRLTRLTQLHVIVLHSLPETVKARTIQRGAAGYNVNKFKAHYSFIKRLPVMKKYYPFKLSIVDNNRSVEEVQAELRQICAPS